MSKYLNGPGNAGNTPPAVRPGSARAKTGTGQTQTQFAQMLTDSVQELNRAAAPGLEPTKKATLPPGRPLPASEAMTEKGFSDILKVVMKHEGRGYVKLDGRHESSKMGILQSTAREYGYAGNIRDLTPADAEKIYYKIWQKSGAAKLPYPLSMVHFDTYVNSPAAARKILAKSGGNTDVYLDMRARRYQRLARIRPEKYARYLKGWMNRIGHLKQVANEEYARANKVRIDKTIG